jgi:hypothetical protein
MRKETNTQKSVEAIIYFTAGQRKRAESMLKETKLENHESIVLEARKDNQVSASNVKMKRRSQAGKSRQIWECQRPKGSKTWCGRRESNPHRPFEPCGFSYRLRLSPPETAQYNLPDPVCGLDYPFTVPRCSEAQVLPV